MTSSRRAWLVWSVGVTAYVVAVLQRTSLGVSGLDATRRFDASASVLASFAVLQLLVYAALQVPVGLLLDRFGSRRLIVSGAVLMAAGQVVLALAETVPLAVVGRVLVGAGDAMTFISVLRLVTTWLPPGRVPRDDPAHRTARAVRPDPQRHPAGRPAAQPGAGRQRSSPPRSASVLAAILVLLVVRDSPTGAPRRPVAPTLARWAPTSRVRGDTPAPGSACGPTSRRSSPARSSRCCGGSRSSCPVRSSAARRPAPS